MVSTRLARNSGAGLKAGIQKVALAYLKQYGKLSIQNKNRAHGTYQALEFGEIRQMADKAGLFKSVTPKA